MLLGNVGNLSWTDLKGFLGETLVGFVRAFNSLTFSGNLSHVFKNPTLTAKTWGTQKVVLIGMASRVTSVTFTQLTRMAMYRHNS